MTINDPCIITTRLLPGVKIGESFLSIEYAKKQGREGRTRYTTHLDTPAFTHTDHECQSGCQGGNLQQGLESVLSFMAACGESYRGLKGENADLYPKNVAQWCAVNSDELSMLAVQVKETPDCIVECVC